MTVWDRWGPPIIVGFGVGAIDQALWRSVILGFCLIIAIRWASERPLP